MEIKVHPKRHHNHYPHTITTLVKKSPKISVTKTMNEDGKIKSIVAGVSKG